MSDLIDRQAAINAIENTECELSSEEWDEITDAIISVQAVDAVEVIRCKYCQFFSDTTAYTGRCTLRGDYVFTNDFCSYAGERRTDETD